MYYSIVVFIIHIMIVIKFMLYYEDSFILEWIVFKSSNINLTIYMIVDWMSCSFSSMVLLISSMILMYSSFYMKTDLSPSRFLYLLLLFVLSMVILIFSPNMFMMMLGWDGLGVVSFCLVIYYKDSSSLRSGLITIYSNRIGDVAMFLCMYLSYTKMGENLMILSGIQHSEFLPMICLAAITKSAQIPFSAWLPAAMAAPTPISSLVHSSTLVTAGVYLLTRFYHPMISMIVSCQMAMISLSTMFVSSMVAIMETDMKKLIAMSTLSQLGLMIYMISMGEWSFGFFHMICHAIFKALLFMCCGGSIMFSEGSQDIRFKGSNMSPILMVSYNASSLSLCGFPFLAGFYSKDMCLESGIEMSSGMFSTFMFYISCLFTILYSVKLMKMGILSYYNNKMLTNTTLEMTSFVPLTLWSCVLGSFMSEYMFMESFFIINLNFKMISLSFLFMYTILLMKKILQNHKLPTKPIISDMMFLFWFSGKPMSSSIQKMSNLLKMDFMWSELISPKLFYMNLYKMSNYFIMMEVSNYKSLFMFIFLMSILTFLYFIYKYYLYSEDFS